MLYMQRERKGGNGGIVPYVFVSTVREQCVCTVKIKML